MLGWKFKSKCNLLQQQSKTRLDEFSAEIRKVRSSLNETQALAQEKEGAALHWKLKFEDKIRENADLVEKYVLDLKGLFTAG